MLIERPVAVVAWYVLKCSRQHMLFKSRPRTNFSLTMMIQRCSSTWHTYSQREKKIARSQLRQQSQASQRRHRHGYPFTCRWQKNVAWDRLSKTCSLLHSSLRSSHTAFLVNKRRIKDDIRIYEDIYGNHLRWDFLASQHRRACCKVPMAACTHRASQGGLINLCFVDEEWGDTFAPKNHWPLLHAVCYFVHLCAQSSLQ